MLVAGRAGRRRRRAARSRAAWRSSPRTGDRTASCSTRRSRTTSRSWRFRPWPRTASCPRRASASAAATQAEAVRLESATGLAAPARSLSGGNQQKVVLGKWLMAKPGVFLLDEPTRGIDVGAKQQVYRLIAELADSGAAVLVVSSEIEELLGLCDRILVMRRGEIAARFARPGLAPREGETAGFDREAILRAALGASGSARSGGPPVSRRLGRYPGARSFSSWWGPSSRPSPRASSTPPTS